MAPKRPASSSSSSLSTPKSKRAKTSTTQRNLESFFRSPSDTSKTREAKAPTSPSKLDDRELAEKIAEADGIDSETARRLEDMWRNERPKPDKSVPDVTQLDADANDSQTRASASAGPSTPRKSGLSPSGKIKKMSKIFDMAPPSSSLPDYADLSVDPPAFLLSGNPPWPPDTPCPYSFLVHALVILSKTRSRIQIVNTLTNCLRLILLHHPQSLRSALYLLSNSLSPPYSPVELGLGSSVITKALQQVSGLTSAALSKLYRSFGDPGDVAFAAKSSVRTLVPHPELTIIGVYESLLKISRVQGQGAAKIKQSIVEKLLLSTKGEESRYLVRTLCLNNRVGASQTTVLSALARAMVLTPPAENAFTLYASRELLESVQPLTSDVKRKSTTDPSRQKLVQLFADAEGAIKRCFVKHPNLDHITAALLDGGLEELNQRVPLTVGIPLRPTLGSPMRSLDEVYDRLEGLPFTAEFKYDGQRAQVHGLRSNDDELSIKIFSRHLENMTDKYPDVVALVKMLFTTNAGLSSFILDAEIVAMDRNNGALRSFQDLSQRARKDVRIEDVKITVCLFTFDLMYFNGQALLGSPLRLRRDIMRTNFPPLTPDDVTVARLAHVESCESDSGRLAVETFWQEAVESRSEGIMVKLLDSGEVVDVDSSNAGNSRRKPFPATYEPGISLRRPDDPHGLPRCLEDKRTSAWLKLKKDYVTGLGDSFDLVPIGAWHGNGRKAKWWSPILLALREPTSGDFVAMTKCMTGFTDAFYKEMKERYPDDSETCSKIPRWNCRLGGFKPSVYFKPQEVWEIRGADITLSPVSVAAMDLVGQRGLSLRFPRFIKTRDDKGLEEASTPEFLVNVWRMQEGRGKEIGKDVDDGDLLDADWNSEAVEEEEEPSSPAG